MLTGIVDSIRHDRAVFLHEVNFIREMANEDVIADRVEKAESQYTRESLEDLYEAKRMCDQMPVDEKVDSAEIKKMMEATENMTFDEMIGIK